MGKKTKLIVSGLIILLVITGVAVFRTVMPVKKVEPVAQESEDNSVISEIDPSISVAVKESTVKDNTVNLTVSGLAGKMATIEYDLSYESQGLIQGVTGGKPIDIAGQDGFDREIYLGTCSRNVCKPHAGVSRVSLVVKLTDPNGKRSQFTGDFDL